MLPNRTPTTDLAPIPTALELVSGGDRPDQSPALVYLASLAIGSRRTMRQALDTIARLLGHADAIGCPWAQLRYQHTAAIRTVLAERYAPATANKMLAALRRVLLEARRLGQLAADDYARAADVRPVKATVLPKGRALAPGELAALMDACARDVTPAGARDAALIAILGRAGLRRSEAAALDMADYDQETGALTVRSGKGNKDRVTYLGAGAAAALADWIAGRGPAPGPLLCAVFQNGRVRRRRLTPQALMLILQKRGQAAGIAKFSPHDLRRTFISDLLDAGADIATVQQLAGHASSDTTARYDRRGEVAKRRAAGLLHLPYRRRT